MDTAQDEVQDVDFQEVDEVKESSEQYKALPKETKESIDKIQGKKAFLKIRKQIRIY